MSESENNKQQMPENVYLIINAQIHPIKRKLTRIGRKLDNDIVLQSEQVSRNHAEIRIEDSQFYLYDLDSSCGTFVNNSKIEKSIIYSGDLILLANVPAMFIDEAGAMESRPDKTTGNLEKS